MIALIIRVITGAAGLAGVSLSPFAVGALLAATVAVGLGITHVRAFNAGASREIAKCEASNLKTQLDQARRDIAVARAAEKDGTDRASRIQSSAAEQKEKDDAYIKTLEGKVRCIPSDDDLRSLQPSNRWRRLDRARSAPRPH